MTNSTMNHFTTDDLDAFHIGSLSSEARLHLETCADCQRLVISDREVLDLLGSMSSYAPSAQLADNVMSRVRVGAPVPVPVLSFPRLTRPRLVAMAVLAAGMVASVAWASAYGSLLQQWLDGSTAALWDLANVGWQSGVRTLNSQAWFETVRQLGDGPVRLAVLSLVLVGGYGTGLLALRRLVTPSTGTVPYVRA